MASRAFYAEKFRACKTEEERVAFPLDYLSTELGNRNGPDRDRLPEGFGRAALNNMEGALRAEGRPDIWDRFVRVLSESRQRSRG